jgi:hypothetical protein
MAGYRVNFTHRLIISALNALFITLAGCAATVPAYALLNPALEIGEW